jgi:multidrug efflux pump subunit AcrB
MDLTPWLPWINLVHVLAGFGFVFVHGTSGILSLRIRGERDRERIKTMTELSGSVIGWGWITLAVLALAGVLSGIVGGWWTNGHLWIWASVVVLVVVAGLMTPIASRYMNGVRHAVGVATYDDLRKKREPPPPASDEELARALAAPQPLIAAAIGVAGLVVLVWLMMMKPF